MDLPPSVYTAPDNPNAKTASANAQTVADNSDGRLGYRSRRPHHHHSKRHNHVRHKDAANKTIKYRKCKGCKKMHGSKCWLKKLYRTTAKKMYGHESKREKRKKLRETLEQLQNLSLVDSNRASAEKMYEHESKREKRKKLHETPEQLKTLTLVDSEMESEGIKGQGQSLI